MIISEMHSLSKTASWVIVRKCDNVAILETFKKEHVELLNTEAYSAVPILEYLQSLNG